jgi:hypothetical protein
MPLRAVLVQVAASNGTRDWRPLVFLAVLMSHAVVVLSIIRAARPAIASLNVSHEPLILTLLRDRPAARPDAGAHRPAPISPHAAPRARTAPREPAPDSAITVPASPSPSPRIDWQQEAELAAKIAAADSEKEGKFRDLSTLSPEQLSWVKRNHMEPVPPGIEWHHPRFEFDRHSGLPILWINDRCVLVTLIVFCGIGRSTANGDLFKHMHDPHDP